MRNNNLCKIVSLLLITILWTTGGFGQGVNLSMMDSGCKPCEDFYRFANGGWLKSNVIPPNNSVWSVRDEAIERTRVTLREILEESAKNKNAVKGSGEQLVGTYYAACMNESKIESEGAKTLAPILNRIEKIETLRDFHKEVAYLHNQGIPTLFEFVQLPDVKNEGMVMGSLGQGGLSAPSRDYYTETRFAFVREGFVKHAAQMFELLGDNAADAVEAAKIILAIQTKLAESSRTPLQLRDINAQYNKRTIAQLNELAPNFGWEVYFPTRGAPKMLEVNVRQPEFFEKMNELLTSVPLDQWKTYLRWHAVNSTASHLSSPFVEENFNFYTRGLTGQQVLQPRWMRCVAATDAALGDALGQLYVKKVFPAESKVRIQTLINNLLTAYRERLMNVEWIGDVTRREALAKLAAIGQKIGYPNKWKTYTGVEIKPDAFLENSFRLASFENNRNLAKIGKRIDRTEWNASPASVNAYYYPPNNEIIFPAAILQPPAFDPKADDAVNYGAIGAVIGHEITHAFDDVGSTFDAAGNLRNWWSEEDRKKFTDRASCVERQFSSFEVEKGLFINGKLTVGENIADLGGLSAALAAYRKSLKNSSSSKKIDGFTPEQRFFIGYAQIWATLARPEYERLLINRSPHSAPRFRVNGPLSNMPEFADAFACRFGDAMFRPKSESCRVW